MKCPGQDTRYWKPGDIFEVECPHCGKVVEFFKDEATRRCRSCKKTVVNPKMDFGCATHCKFAAECLGDIGPELLAKRNDLLKDRVAHEVKRRLGKNFQKLGHAVKVARNAEDTAGTHGAELAPVLCAAYLHVFAEPAQAEDQEAGAIRQILEELGAGADMIGAVLDIIERFQKGSPEDSTNARAFFDAHLRASQSDDNSAALTQSGTHLAAAEATL